MTKKASTAVTLSSQSSASADPSVFDSSSSDGGCPAAAEGGHYFDRCGVARYFLSGDDDATGGGDGDGGYGWYGDKRTASAAASNDIDRGGADDDDAGVVDVKRKLLGFFKEIEPADIDDGIDCGHVRHDGNCNESSSSSSSSRPMTTTTMTATADATTSPTATAKTTSAIRTLLKLRRQSVATTTRRSENNTPQSQITTALAAYTEDAIIVGNTTTLSILQQQQRQPPPPPPQSLSLSSPLSACYPEYYYYYANGGGGGNGPLEPIDFDPSTWLDAIRQTIVSSVAVRYGATAAAALTAAIVVHPIAIIGAVPTGIIAGTLLWAVGYYHDAAADDVSRYKLWQGEEVFGRLFWSENETETATAAAAAADGSAEDDVVKKVVEIDEKGMTRLVEESDNSNNDGEGNSINDNYNNNNNNNKNDEGFVAAVAGFFGGGTWSTSEQQRLIMKQSQIKDNDEEERRGVVTVVKLNEKEEEERGVDDASISLTTIMTTRTPPPGKKKIISKATIKRNARERIRRIRSAPTKDIFVSVTEVRPDTPPSNAVDDAVDNNMPSVDRVSSSIPTIKTATTIHVIPDDDDDDNGNGNNNINDNDKQRLNNNVIDTHFPPLEVCVMESVKLVGLNSATQFFDVFFADDAPYSMRDFQKKRGDVDVVYGKWEDCLVEEGRDNTTTTLSPRIEEGEGGGDASLLYSVKEGANVIPLPPNSTRQRTLQFNTLTKSYFGPAYAKATKVQRATLLSSNQLLVIENVTHLSDIPYADRFRVIERWVLEVVEGGGNEDIITYENGNNSTKQRLSLGRSQSFGPTSSSSDGQNNITTNACCKLTVHAEVQMLQPCSWEAQIRKKASETFTEVVQDWCKSATVALAATEEQMRKRLRVRVSLSDVIRNEQQQGSIDGKVAERRIPPSPAMIMTRHRSVSLARGRSDLLAIHKRNFDQLEKRVANGDLEWCSIEVMHSSPVCVRKDGRSSGVVGSTTLSSEYATVLEYPSLSLNDYETPTCPMNNNADDDVKMARFTSQRKVAAAVLMRTRSSKLFKKLSSRRRTSNDKPSTG